MIQENNRIYKVDKTRVVLSYFRWQVVMELFLLFLSDNFNLVKTIKDSQFWWLTIMIIFLGLFADFWEIQRGKIKFIDKKIIDFTDNNREGIDLSEFSAIKDAKTIYGRCLGLEYKIPKGITVRKLFQYNFYSNETLQEILQEIVKINPDIELDDMVKKMLLGTFKNK